MWDMLTMHVLSMQLFSILDLACIRLVYRRGDSMPSSHRLLLW